MKVAEVHNVGSNGFDDNANNLYNNMSEIFYLVCVSNGKNVKGK